MYGCRFWESLVSWGPIQAARDWWTLDSINWWEREPLEGAACAPEEPMPIPELCAACQQQSSNGSLQQCSRCKRVYYCSVECQRQHWKQHKGNCSGAAANGALLSFLRAACIFVSGSASANAFHGLRQRQHWMLACSKGTAAVQRSSQRCAHRLPWSCIHLYLGLGSASVNACHGLGQSSTGNAAAQ